MKQLPKTLRVTHIATTPDGHAIVPVLPAGALPAVTYAN